MKTLIKKIVPPALVPLLTRIRFCGRDKAAWLESRRRHMESELKLPPVADYASPIDVTIGIIKDPMLLHQYYVYACREMKVRYRLCDVFGAGWYEECVGNSECAAFLVAPRLFSTAWRQMYDERLRVIAESGKILFPSYEELWMYESKRRMSYWVESHGFDGPKTHVFYSYLDAMDFAGRTDLPIVAKTDAGYAAQGVHIFRDRSEVVKHVRRCFNKGLRLDMGAFHPLVENGFVLFQEYVSTPIEWRLIRLGDSYFAHQKLKSGDFHSGSHLVGRIPPGRAHLDLIRRVTEVGGFRSLNVDVFELDDGRLLINELQALPCMIKPFQMVLNGYPGRYLYDASGDRWLFEKGTFCENKGSNLRLQALLAGLGHRVEIPRGSWEGVLTEEIREESIRRYKEYSAERSFEKMSEASVHAPPLA